MRDKAQWSEAARDDPEKLTIDEFLAFRHPESSHASILQIVEETLDRLGEYFLIITIVNTVHVLKLQRFEIKTILVTKLFSGRHLC